MDESAIDELIRTRHPGRALERPFYCDPDLFEREMERVISRQWLLVDHASRIPNEGDFFLFEIAGESIVVVRGKAGEIHAFFNVCRHRGSRVCRERQGNTKRFVCPYHAWTYGLDGALRSAPLMPEEFVPTEVRLSPCHVRVLDGLIFLNLAERDPTDFDAQVEPLLPFLRVHGLGRAKVAHRELYPTEANWKLIVENYLECYHCAPAHPQFSSVHSKAKILAMGAGLGSGPEHAMAAFQQELAAWQEKARSLGHPTGLFNDQPGSPYWRSADRAPIGRGFLSESQDGEPVAPLMGEFKDYDGGQTAISFNPVSHLLMSNDTATLFRFTPTGPTTAEMEVIWLVDEHAREGADYDVKRVSWMWDVTTRQDQGITENNQAGVMSRRYRPGPYSQLEGAVESSVLWYLGLMSRPGDDRD